MCKGRLPTMGSYSVKVIAISFLYLLDSTSSTGNFCGTSWMDAVGQCSRPCPTGAPTQCGSGETCFAYTPCVQVEQVPPPTPNPTPRPIVAQPPQQQQQEANTNNNNNNGPYGNVQTSTATCGNGNRGNGKCPNTVECCSQYGHCGTTPAHCDVDTSSDSTNIGSINNVNANTNNGGVAGTCGGGKVGNNICTNPMECCSEYGFCGTTPSHCAGGQQQQAVQPIGQPSTSQNTPQFNQQGVLVPITSNTPPTPQFFGSCGDGQTGNGICPKNSECCSEHGFCGTTLEYCMNKVGADFPGQPTQSGNEAQQQVQQPQFSNNNTPNPYNPVAPHGTNKKILGYYAGWQWYDRDKLASPSNMDFRKVQRVNYAFFQPDVNGNIYGTDRWGDPQVLFGPYSSKMGGGVQKCSYDGPSEVNCAYHEVNTGLIYQAYRQGAEVYPSIGGWTLSDNFPVISANPVSRDAFAKNCVEILTYYEFDGIDIDWEYPGYVDHSGTPGDRLNFTKMLAAIKAALETLTRSTGKVYGLTAALPCNPDNIANIEVGKISTILTEFNLMSYDLHGSWDEVTGTNAPLYYQGFGNEEFNIHSCVEKYVDLGVPREKINIGLPFYGRSFKGSATGLNQPHQGNDLANWPEDEGTPQYYNIYNKLSYMTQMRDNKSKTQIAYTNTDKQIPVGLNKVDSFAQTMSEGMISFDDERAICDKVDYVQQNNLNGFIIWELSGDMLEDLRTPLLDITNAKLANPSMKCCLLHSEDECEKERLESQQMSNSQGFDASRWGADLTSGSIQRREGSVISILSASAVLLFAARLCW